jgi:hypothetical protein
MPVVNSKCIFMCYAYFLIFVAVEVSFDALCLFSAQNCSFHDWNSEVGSDFCCLYVVLQQYCVTFWNWLVFQNCQSGEQSYIHVGCSAHCLSVSCNYEYDKSIVSCIRLDRCFQFKYESRKVCSVQLKCFDNYVMFHVMNLQGVFSLSLSMYYMCWEFFLHLDSMCFSSSCIFYQN